MSTRIIPILLAFVVAALAVVLWVRGGGPTEDAPLPHLGAPAIEGPGADAGGPQPSGAGEIPDPRAEVPGPEPSGTASTGTRPDEARGAGAVPDALAAQARREREILLQSFEEKYGHLRRDELRGALNVMSQVVGDRRRELCDQRYARGDYVVVRPGDPPQAPLEPDARGRLPESDSRALTDPVTARSEAHLTHLPFDEYPDFYALLDEQAWLAERLAREERR